MNMSLKNRRWLVLAGLMLAALSACATDSGTVPGPRAAPCFFRQPLDEFPKWERVRDAEAVASSFEPAGLARWPARARTEWLALRGRLAKASVTEQLTEVNEFFNRLPYREDRELWQVEEYWALPWEFVLHGGDCEDFAIAKYYALKALGLPDTQLRLAGVWDKEQLNGHVLLLAESGGSWRALDSQTPAILPWPAASSRYSLVYTVNEGTVWPGRDKR